MKFLYFSNVGFCGGSDGEESACKAGDLSPIPGSGSSPGEGNGNPLEYSCLENPMDGVALQTPVVAESDTTERLHLLTYVSNETFLLSHHLCVHWS